MKKLAILLLVALIALIISTSAYAFVIPIGEWNAHFSDFTSVYHNGVGQPAGYIPVAGDYIKSVVNLEQVIPKGSGLEVWHASAHDQVAGFEYNFEFLGLIGVAGSGSEKTYWGPVTVPQSRIDLYARDPFVWNTGAGFAPRTGPEAVDLNNAPSIVGLIAGINDAGSSLLIGMHSLLHPDQTFPGATLVLTGNILTGLASGDIYAVADSGSFLPQIDHQILGPAQIACDFYLKFSSNINQPLYGWGARSEDPAEFSTITPTPCIDIEKEISVDGGITWHDADTEATAPVVTAPHGALYRLIVTNCGNVDLTNVVINDSTLGITNYLVGNLAAGASVTLTDGQIPQLKVATRCRTAGSFGNRACATGSGNGTTLSDCDDAWLVCEEALPCRVTAGGVKDGITVPCTLKLNGMPDPKTCAEAGFDTWGGQAGAPPTIDGNWTHHHYVSSKKSFVFHSNDLFEIICSDPGCCVPACANAKNRQIDFKGIGRFTNQKGYSFPTGILCFSVHLEDIGEPGPGGRWPSATDPCTHCPGTAINDADCINCTDYYEIRIYGNDQCTGSPIYVNGMPPDPALCPGSPFVGYFTRSGNVQMHPDNNGP